MHQTLILQNQDDVSWFTQYLLQTGAKFFRICDGQEVSPNDIRAYGNMERYAILFDVGSMQKLRRSFYSYIHEQAYIEYDPCYRIKGEVRSGYVYQSHIQPGRICFVDESLQNNSSLDTTYLKIVKHIKTNYTLSDDKRVYIGTGFLREWYEFRVSTICSLQFKRLQMEGDENTLLQMFARIREKGYIVEVCGEKIYEESVFNVSAECFFVHRGVAPMEIRSRKKYFSCDTEGCFIYRKKNKAGIRYIIDFDRRFLLNNNSNMSELYVIISSFLSSRETIPLEGS